MNHLGKETSPYLLQHAQNPVHWYPWGQEALQKAIEEDKPILVSIGYAACHWCHVMERESFEDLETAQLMNDSFINIKIDREERPDLDHIYMDAVQTMTGSGGWPLNVFLTPQKKPFYGGTYFPPQALSNRPSWKDVLSAVADAFKNKRTALEGQAASLTQQLLDANNFGWDASHDTHFSLDEADMACQNILQQSDKVWGGFGRAPKFPQTQVIRYLLRYYALEKNRPEALAQEALQQALLSLDKMMDGGIYDQAGGGFSRYSTDTEWLAPHFEKMLYDNALLVTTLSEAYQITALPRYRHCIEQTLEFIHREMTDAQGGFYAALDADSEGVEGQFYVWQESEIYEILGKDAPIFCRFYDVSASGNWEEKNILRILKPATQFAQEEGMEVEELEQFLNTGRKALLGARAKKIRPALDDKIILGWNALMNTAYSKAYEATGQEAYRQTALLNMQFLLTAFQNPDGSLAHTYKSDARKFPAFLDDLAYLMEALIQLHRITADTHWLQLAHQFCNQVQAQFPAADTGYFYYTPQHQEDVILRKKELYDGATPSGNAVMAANLLALSQLFDQPEWKVQAQKMLAQLSKTIIKFPGSFGAWMLAFYQLVKPPQELVLMGDYSESLAKLLKSFLPHALIMASDKERNDYPLFVGKATGSPLWLYACQNYSCAKPVSRLEDLLAQLNG